MNVSAEAKETLDTYLIGQQAQVETWKIASGRDSARPAQTKATRSGRTDWRDAVGLAYAGEDPEEVRKLVALDRVPPDSFLDATYTYGRISIFNVLGDREQAIREARGESYNPKIGISVEFKIRHQLLAGDSEGAKETARKCANPLTRAIELGKLGLHEEAARICDANHLADSCVWDGLPRFQLLDVARALIAGKKFSDADALADAIENPYESAKIFVKTGNIKRAKTEIDRIGQAGDAEKGSRELVRETLRITGGSAAIANIVAKELEYADVHIAWPKLKAELYARVGDAEAVRALAPDIDPFDRCKLLEQIGDHGDAIKTARTIESHVLRAHRMVELGQWAEAFHAARAKLQSAERPTRWEAKPFIDLIEKMNLPELAKTLQSLPEEEQRELIRMHAGAPIDFLKALARMLEPEIMRTELAELGRGTRKHIREAMQTQLAKANGEKHILELHQRPLKNALSGKRRRGTQ